MKYGMMIDLKRCVGCNACAIACSRTNHTPSGHFRTHVESSEEGTYPNTRFVLTPYICQHCEKPQCIEVCPTKASYKDENGIVRVDNSRCIGCQYCVMACPYKARHIDVSEVGYFPDSIEQPSAYEQFLLKDGGQGYIDKCVFCHDRVEQGLQPACVQTCPASARVFGDLDDPQSMLSRTIAERKARTLLPELGLEPNVYYAE